MLLIIDSIDTYLKGLEVFLSPFYRVKTYLINDPSPHFKIKDSFILFLLGLTDDFYPYNLKLAGVLKEKGKLILFFSEDCLSFLPEIAKVEPHSYLHRNAPSKIVLKAVEDTLQGKTFIDRKIAPWLLSLKEKEELFKKLTLTETEKKILKFLEKNLTNKEIASNLKVSEATIKFHLSNIFKKTNTRNRKDLKDFLST